MIRPSLPIHHANPYIQALLSTGIPDVKYQILSCQGNDILVGRLKISTPTASGHAFILRRYDTGAISLTTMFRAAFPTASEDDEKREIAWVKDTFDLTGNNGTAKDPSISRLAGTWVDPDLAQLIAREYRISEMIAAIIEARPDPDAPYRRSGGAGAAKGPIAVNLSKVNAPASPSVQMTAAPVTSSIKTSSTITSSIKSTSTTSTIKPPSTTSSIKPPSRTTITSPTAKSSLPAAKRRKESSPAPDPTRSPSESPRPARRSARTRSPAPTPSSIVPLTASRTTPKKPSRVEDVVTPGGSDETAVDEEGEGVSGAIAGSELHDEDVAEQKQMIAEMKALRDAAKQNVKEEAMEEDEESNASDGEVETEEPKVALKRTREDDEDQLKFNFQEPQQEDVAERQIATNRRVPGFRLEPRQKSFAWGVAAFAIGFGAVSLLPNLF